MASVSPADSEAVGKLMPKQQLDIMSGGLFMNILFSCAAFSFVTTDNFTLLMLIIFGLLVIVLKKVLSRYILPFASLCSVYLLPGIIAHVIKIIPDAGHGTYSTVQSIAFNIVTWREAVFMAGSFSILLALLNLLPLFPFDGGQLTSIYLSKFLPSRLVSRYRMISIVIVGLLMLIGTYDLICAIGRGVWKLVAG